MWRRLESDFGGNVSGVGVSFSALYFPHLSPRVRDDMKRCDVQIAANVR